MNRIDSIERSLFLDRFLKYVKFDTQSSEESDSCPSTEKQLDLSRQLVNELKELHLWHIELTKYGYVFATLPSNVDYDVPVIGLIAHIDTTPEVSGKNVNPIIHKNYQGGDIIGDDTPSSQLIESALNPELKGCIGHDIITGDGTTLLGADDKAGIAEIMGAISYLVDNQHIPHGEIRIAFNVDEEIGRGTDYFDIKKFGTDYAYTVDGCGAGEIEMETFNAESVIITIKGKNVHPGYAKNKLINGIKIAAELIEHLPKNTMSPETTEEREGYIHPHKINGGVEFTELTFLIRDFTIEGLKDKKDFLKKVCISLEKKYAPASIQMTIKESYRNMKYILDNYPDVVDYAMEAVQQAGLKPKKHFARGGTDGAVLCYKGLPTPNIFTGGHNPHSTKEWISIQHMEKAVKTIIHLVQIWAEKSKTQEKTSTN